jgi:hypothetical protein
MSMFSRTSARRWRTASAAVATAALALFTTGIAMADTVTSDGDTLKTSGNIQFGTTANASTHACADRGTPVSGSITIAYSNAGADPKHFTGSESLTVEITNTTPGITVTSSPASPSIPAVWADGSSTSLTLSTTVATSVPAGTYAVGITVTGSSSGVLRTDGYSVGVAAGCPTTSTNTAPTVTVTGVTDGANYDKGSVPTALCHVVDTEDGPVADSAATRSSITGPDAADGIGSQTASCSYTDHVGLSDSDSATYSIGDPTAPAISYVLDPSAPTGANSWYTGDVTLTWIVSDPQSPNSLHKTGCVDQSITADQTSVTYACSATSAGGSTGPVSVSIKRDASKPTIGHALDPATPNGNGWYQGDVTVTFSCDDVTSGVQSCVAGAGPGSSKTLTEGGSQSVTGTATDVAGNTQTDTVSGINIDKTAPTIGHTLSPSTPNANGWFNSDVTVTFACDDALSGVASCTVDGESGNSKTLGEGASQSISGTATDAAGNTKADTASGISIDEAAPSVGLVGGPADGTTYYFGFVPAAPTCNASDLLSGLDGTCSVTGYSNAIGTHTVTATATDLAGNQNTATATYTVSAWTLTGFYQPVDMGGVLNTVKGGSTVPLKFELFAGPTELTDTTLISSFTATKINCISGAPTDAVETLATTGGTSLRYDTTGGQFIQNWKTPTVKGACYAATMTALDGSSITALFQIK